MRLIDADDFKKFLRALCKAGAPYEEVIQLIDRQPTAYDVNRVVERIDNEVAGITNLQLLKIDEIVKEGYK